MIHKEEHVSQIKCPADKFFAMFKHDMLDIPKNMPGSYKSVKVLEGDGKSVGTVRLWTYVLKEDPNKVLTAEEKLEELDDKNRRLTMRILKGDIMEDYNYKSLAIKLLVTPTSDGGSLVKWTYEFEKKHDDSPHPHTHLELFAVSASHFGALLHQPVDE